jgi:hypothetical protein
MEDLCHAWYVSGCACYIVNGVAFESMGRVLLLLDAYRGWFHKLYIAFVWSEIPEVAFMHRGMQKQK